MTARKAPKAAPKPAPAKTPAKPAKAASKPARAATEAPAVEAHEHEPDPHSGDRCQLCGAKLRHPGSKKAKR